MGCSSLFEFVRVRIPSFRPGEPASVNARILRPFHSRRTTINSLGASPPRTLFLTHLLTTLSKQLSSRFGSPAPSIRTTNAHGSPTDRPPHQTNDGASRIKFDSRMSKIKIAVVHHKTNVDSVFPRTVLILLFQSKHSKPM